MRAPHRPGHKVQRVLVLSHMFPHPSHPGNGCFVHEQVAALRKYEDLDVRVISCRPLWVNTRHPMRLLRAARTYADTLRRPSWSEHEGVPVLYPRYLVGGPLGFWTHGFTYRQPVLWALKALRRHFPFDLVHAHTGYLDGVAGLAAARRSRVPLVITEHTGPFTHLTGKMVVRQLTLRALGAAQRVWCVSSALAREVCSYYPKDGATHIVCLPNGVDTERFFPPQRWQPNPARPRLLAVGNLEPDKNHALLLSAMRQVVRAVPGATLDILGDGTMRRKLEARVRELELERVVTLHGHRDRDEVARRMREECDLLVLPSTGETFGVVLIEALACGKPVVATRCGGPEDIVSHPWLGRLCPVEEGALAESILTTLAQLDSFSPTRIRQYILDNFDYRAVARALAQQYQEVAEAFVRA